MKKLIILSIFCLSLLGSGQIYAQQITQEQQQQTKFYYYPSSNVYQNTSTNEYWYYDDANNTWTSVKDLPSTVTLVKDPSYVVYYKGSDVWKDNAEHIKKYKVNKKGHVKVKG